MSRPTLPTPKQVRSLLAAAREAGWASVNLVLEADGRKVTVEARDESPPLDPEWDE